MWIEDEEGGKRGGNGVVEGHVGKEVRGETGWQETCVMLLENYCPAWLLFWLK